MRKQIAYILKMYPRFSETFIVNEILELERQGVEVQIFSLYGPNDGRFHARLAEVQAPVTYVPQHPEMYPNTIRRAHKRLRKAIPETYFNLWNAINQNKSYRKIKTFLQAGFIADALLRSQVDLVHAHFASVATDVALLVHQLIGVPFTFTAHAKDIYHSSVKPAKLAEKLAAAHHVVTVSRYNKNYLDSLLGDRNADIRCLYNGIDLDFFHPAATSRLPAQVLGVGRLVEKKGFDVLVRACALLRDRGVDFNCKIIGKGERRDDLNELIRTLGLEEQVVLAGPMTQESLRAAYQNATIFTLPCRVAADNNQDGLPTVLLEAMASGLPCISTELNGIPEIIDHQENGLLVRPDDVQALADALQTLLADPKLRDKLSTAALRKVQSCFDVRKNVGRLLHWFIEVPVERWASLPAEEQEQLQFELPKPARLEEVFSLL